MPVPVRPAAPFAYEQNHRNAEAYDGQRMW